MCRSSQYRAISTRKSICLLRQHVACHPFEKSFKRSASTYVKRSAVRPLLPHMNAPTGTMICLCLAAEAFRTSLCIMAENFSIVIGNSVPVSESLSFIPPALREFAKVSNTHDLTTPHPCVMPLPPSFLCENYYQRLQLAPDDVLGRPLSTIVDPRDAYTLRTAIWQVINNQASTTGGAGAAQTGTLVNLRILCSGFSCQASMTMVIGSQGIIVVTRLYDI